jgi:hypothetical protein
MQHACLLAGTPSGNIRMTTPACCPWHIHAIYIRGTSSESNKQDVYLMDITLDVALSRSQSGNQGNHCWRVCMGHQHWQAGATVLRTLSWI